MVYLAQLRGSDGQTIIDHTVETAKPGDVIDVESVKSYTPTSTQQLVHENFGQATPAVTTSINKITFRYRSRTSGGVWLTVYGRAYLPDNPSGNLSIFGFAPGTTGIGDQCAASLEVPAKSNWANYDSHLAAYASQGYAVVTTDYEGMRDPSRIHHYMVGELEGRALLDAVRALTRLTQTQGRLNTGDIYIGGYSQGGHAAFWADKLVSKYAPELSIKGVIGYGPVMSVKTTLADVTHGANINWFGPYVLYSYHDYYTTTYPLKDILLPVTADRLNTDVPAHCIDTDIAHWGRNPAGVYAPDFLKVLAEGGWEATSYAALSRQLDQNEVGPVTTKSAKRVNTGALDNVVLPSQQTTGVNILCSSSSGPVSQVTYPKATHYDTMLQSFADTVTWMRSIGSGQVPASTCTKPAGQ